MQNYERKLHLDICDYNRNVVCPLYDFCSNVSGQATDIYVTTERNGWKELSFVIPSVCFTENGQEPNYRLDYLKADYLIRVIDDVETDWFIISEPKITHSAYAKNVSVVAGHVAQLLKHKNLGLEFSDDEGNNIGSAEELLTTILHGTGWSVGNIYPFAEKDGSTKYRSLKASAKTGAFKLIATMCDLFDAKPIYHGDTRTVDIVPINPFSEPVDGLLPDVEAGEVVELHYGKNVSNVTRTLNTENIVTKLYAYGSYGDKTSGYCGIDECTHTEYIFTLTSACSANKTYYFEIEDDAKVKLVYHFTPTVNIAAGSKLIYSLLDPSSMLYVWDDSNKNAYPVKKGTSGQAIACTSNRNTDVQNWFQFVMNFDYYREVGLLTDEMIQSIANYQRTAPALYEIVSQKSLAMSDAQTELSKTIGYIDFCKLKVKTVSNNNGYIALQLNKDDGDNGVVYRTDYDQSADNYFEWRVTESLNSDGDPINAAAGVVYIIHNTSPITWDKAYLKVIDNEDDPSALTLWAEYGKISVDPSSDRIFLFSYNGINGHLGTLESSYESAMMSLEEATKVVTVDHPVIFTKDGYNDFPAVSTVNGYGWVWRYADNSGVSRLYFTCTDAGDTSWRLAHFQDYEPTESIANNYWFDWRHSVLYKYDSKGNRIALDTSAFQKIASVFATVYMYGQTRDRLIRGLYEKYVYQVPAGQTLAAGNYFFKSGYDSYWAFTTTEQLSGGDTLTYDYDDAWVTQKKGTIETTLKPKSYRFDSVSYHPLNNLHDVGFENGAFDAKGESTEQANSCRTQSHVSVVPSTAYTISGLKSGRTMQVYCYDDKKGFLSLATVSSNSFTTPANCVYVRITVNATKDNFAEQSDVVIRATNIANTIIIEDLNYTWLEAVADNNSALIGLNECISKFANSADNIYGTLYQELKTAQNEVDKAEQLMISSLGDLYREGWWNDASYVDGDEQKLYDDALDNLKQIAMPEATYAINYLDSYGSNLDNHDYGAAHETIDWHWPDLTINAAVHLVDPEISVNTWAFVDKIQRCYDRPWNTKITINTNLSTIAQHSFTDVMTNIATVASEMKGKTSYYDKTLSSAASTSLVVQLAANIAATEKELNSTYTKIEQNNNQLIKRTTAIIQTAEGIKLSAEAIGEQVQSAILTIEPDKIMSVVSQSTSYKDLTNIVNTASSSASSASASAKNSSDAAISASNSAATSAAAATASAQNASAALTQAQTYAAQAQKDAQQAQKDASDSAALVIQANSAVQSAVAAVQAKNKIYAQADAPTGASTNDLWIDTNDKNQLYRYNGSTWVSARDASLATASALQQTNSEISAIVGLNDEATNTMYPQSALKVELNGIHGAVYDTNGNVKSILSQTKDSIIAGVESKGNTTNGLNFNHMAITNTGVNIKSNGVLNIQSNGALNIDGGNLYIKSKGQMRVESGGSMYVESGGNIHIASSDNNNESAVDISQNGVQIGSTGSFTVNSKNFSVDSDGKLHANGVNINGSVSHNGYPVLTKGYDIHIGSEEPSNKHIGMLWISPAKSSDGGTSGGTGGTTVPTAKDTTFTQEDYLSTHHYFYNSGSKTLTLIPSTYSVGGSGQYTYTATVPIYCSARSSGQSGANIHVSINGGVIEFNGQIKYTASESTSARTKTLTLTASSNVWLGDLPSISATISTSRISTSYLSGNFAFPNSSVGTMSITAKST
jgi:hypothetical protein